MSWEDEKDNQLNEKDYQNGITSTIIKHSTDEEQREKRSQEKSDGKSDEGREEGGEGVERKNEQTENTPGVATSDLFEVLIDDCYLVSPIMSNYVSSSVSLSSTVEFSKLQREIKEGETTEKEEKKEESVDQEVEEITFNSLNFLEKSHNDLPSPEGLKQSNQIVILDFDDTLVPSHLVTHGKNTEVDQVLVLSLKQELENYDLILLSFLRKILRQTKSCYIVTMASLAWVGIMGAIIPKSYCFMKAWFKIVSASEQYYIRILRISPSIATNPQFNYKISTLCKTLSFCHILDPMTYNNSIDIANFLDHDLHPVVNFNRKINIISIGDSPAEKNALKSVCSLSENLLHKNITLQKFPNLETLQKQLLFLTSILESLFLSDSDLDLDLNRITREKKPSTLVVTDYQGGYGRPPMSKKSSNHHMTEKKASVNISNTTAREGSEIPIRLSKSVSEVGYLYPIHEETSILGN